MNSVMLTVFHLINFDYNLGTLRKNLEERKLYLLYAYKLTLKCFAFRWDSLNREDTTSRQCHSLNASSPKTKLESEELVSSVGPKPAVEVPAHT